MIIASSHWGILYLTWNLKWLALCGFVIMQNNMSFHFKPRALNLWILDSRIYILPLLLFSFCNSTPICNHPYTNWLSLSQIFAINSTNPAHKLSITYAMLSCMIEHWNEFPTHLPLPLPKKALPRSLSLESEVKEYMQDRFMHDLKGFQ